MDKQREKTFKLFQLIQDNPDLKIVPMVENVVCGGDEFPYWLAGWGNSKIDYMYIYGEEVYFKSTDEERLGDRIFDHLEVANPAWSDALIEEETDKRLEELNWEQVIRVNITLPN